MTEDQKWNSTFELVDGDINFEAPSNLLPQEVVIKTWNADSIKIIIEYVNLKSQTLRAELQQDDHNCKGDFGRNHWFHFPDRRVVFCNNVWFETAGGFRANVLPKDTTIIKDVVEIAEPLNSEPIYVIGPNGLILKQDLVNYNKVCKELSTLADTMNVLFKQKHDLLYKNQYSEILAYVSRWKTSTCSPSILNFRETMKQIGYDQHLPFKLCECGMIARTRRIQHGKKHKLIDVCYNASQDKGCCFNLWRKYQLEAKFKNLHRKFSREDSDEFGCLTGVENLDEFWIQNCARKLRKSKTVKYNEEDNIVCKKCKQSLSDDD